MFIIIIIINNYSYIVCELKDKYRDIYKPNLNSDFIFDAFIQPIFGLFWNIFFWLLVIF